VEGSIYLTLLVWESLILANKEATVFNPKLAFECTFYFNAGHFVCSHCFPMGKVECQNTHATKITLQNTHIHVLCLYSHQCLVASTAN